MRATRQALLASSLLLASSAIAGPPSYGTPQTTCPKVDAGFDADKVIDRAVDLSSHSWEFGTASEALLELYNPELAVFSPAAFPQGKVPRASPQTRSLAYAKKNILTNNQTLVNGDGASGDPASLGVSALLIGQTNKVYLDAAKRQENYLINTVPRMSNGAISQRDKDKEAWADFMFMAPPFLAYYAAATNDLELLKETVRQCGLYRELLYVKNSNWKHILVEQGTTGPDPGLWATGNGWSAAGMARVLGVIQNWGPAHNAAQAERKQLVQWIKEIIDGAMKRSLDNGLLRNYLNDTTWFGDNSATSLIAATTYRMAVLEPATFDDKYVRWADERRKVVAKNVGPNGIISPAVNPLGWGDRTPYTAGSPEGQSFGAMLYAAYRDYLCTRRR